jgi:outer membrane protein assembly factor BamB
MNSADCRPSPGVPTSASALLFALTTILTVVPAQAADAPSGWPSWRGPLGTGVSPDGDPPLEWSEERNVRFKVEIDGDGLASPVVSGDSIFVLSSQALDPEAYAHSKQAATESSERREWPPKVAPVAERFLVTAFSRVDGSVLWQRTASEHVPHESHYPDTSWACGSPVTDGERVYAHFGSNGTYAFSLEGELLWDVDLGDMTTRNGFGEGTTPALAGGALIINWDHEGDSFIVALDKRTGEELWRKPRPGELTSWATPAVIEHDGRTQVVVAAAGRTRSYDPADGSELWSLSGLGTNVIPTPTHEAGVVYLASGKRDSNMLQAVRLDGASGKLEGSGAVLWTRAKDTPYVATPLLYRGQLYFFKHVSSILSAVDAASGEAYYTQRLKGFGNVYASPVAASGRVYLFGRGGESLVLRHGPEFEVLAENSLDDGFDASPAIVGDEMYLRGRRFLYAISRTEAEGREATR